jgi:predicted nucleic acid-binding protein
MNTRIVVDTSVWIDFFIHPQASVTLQLKQLLRDRRVVLVGMVLAEILQGIKNPRESKQVRETLKNLPFLETPRTVWQRAGDLSAGLRRQGLTIPLSDLVIAATAIGEEAEVFTRDPHFEKVPGIKLYTFPESV